MSKENAHFQLEKLILKYLPWVPLTLFKKSFGWSAIFFTKRYARNGLARSKRGPRPAPARADLGVAAGSSGTAISCRKLGRALKYLINPYCG